jgi:DNA mismatch endonuclease Vsr
MGHVAMPQESQQRGYEKAVITKMLRYGRADGPVSDTAPERATEKWLTGLGFTCFPYTPNFVFKDRCCLKQYIVKGAIVDFYLPNLKLCIFVDGCYWHGHQCGVYTKSQKNISAQLQKDERHNKTLAEFGYRVVRIWECSIRKEDFSDIEKSLKLQEESNYVVA